MKRARIFSVAFSLMIAAGLASCASSGNPAPAAAPAAQNAQVSTPAAAEEPAASGEKEIVDFYYATDLDVTLNPMIEAYKEVAPDVEIVSHVIPNDDYDDKIKVLMAGSAQDLDALWLRTPAVIKQYIANNTLEDLTPYAEASGVNLDLIRETSLKGAENADGSAFFGLPLSGSCWLLFYNKEIFDAQGREYPDGLTWDEYRQLAMEMTTEENGQKIWGGVIPPWTMNLGASSAGEYLTDPEPLPFTRQYAQLLYDLYTGDKSHISLEEMNSGMFDVNAAFEAGNIAMMVNGDWTFRLLGQDNPMTFEYAAAHLPVFDGVEPGSSVGQASCFVVSAQSDNKQASYDFIEFATISDTGTAIIAKTDVPAYATDAALEVYKQSVTIPGVEHRFTSKVGLEQGTDENYGAIGDAYKEELQLFILGEQDLDTMFNNFFELRAEILE